MNIGIIGSGNVGGTLGTRWAKKGHAVIFSSRDPKGQEIQKVVAAAGPSAKAAAAKEAAQGSEVVVVATPWPATRQALESAGDLSGKVLIDCTNPLLPDLSGLEVGNTTSGAEQVAKWCPSAKVVKCFNTVGSNVMENPTFRDGRVVMFYCGDDPGAKQTAAQLATELGFDAADAGPLSQARLLEPFALLWISLALKFGYSRDIAFQFLRHR